MADILSKLVVQITADDSSFQKTLNNIQTTTAKVGKSLTKNLTLPLVAIGTASIKIAADFESSMNRVKALTGATAEEFTNLQNRARELGATTEFSASQAAEAMAFFAQAGFDANKIYDVLPDTLNLASAAQLELGTSADIVSNIMTGFGIEASQLGNVVDILTKQFTSSNTDLSQLGEAFKYVAPIAAGLGVSIEETSAALGLLSDAGIQAGSAGTGLRRVLTVLVSESEKLGISVTDAAGNMLPLYDIIGQLEKRGLTTAEALEIFGDRGGPAISQLLSVGSAALEQYTKRLSDVDGLAKNIAQTQLEGLNGEFKNFKSALEEAAIVLGNEMLPKATELIAEITDLVRKFSQLDEDTKKNIISFGLAAAAIGPVTNAISVVVGAVAKLSVVLATNPILLIATAAALAGVALYKAYDNATTLKDETKKLKNITDELKKSSEEYQEVVKKLTTDTNQLTDAERNNLEIKKQQLKIKIIDAIDKLESSYRKNLQALNKQYIVYLTFNEELKKTQKRLKEIKEEQSKLDENTTEYLRLENERIRLLYLERQQIQDVAKELEQYTKLQTEQQAAIEQVARAIVNGIITLDELALKDELLRREIELQVAALQKQAEAQQNNTSATEESTIAKQKQSEEIEKNTEKIVQNTAEIIGNTENMLKMRDAAIEAGIAIAGLSYEVNNLNERQTDLANAMPITTATILAQIQDLTTQYSSIINEVYGSLTDVIDMYYQNIIDNENLSDEEIKKAKKDQWKANKAFAIGQSIIDTLVAATKVLPNIPLSLLIGGIGAAKTALIASQPMPKFQNGGIVENSGTGQQFIAGDGVREYIVPDDRGYLSELGQNIVDSFKGQQINNQIDNEVTQINQIVLDSRIVQEIVTKGTQTRQIRIYPEAVR